VKDLFLLFVRFVNFYLFSLLFALVWPQECLRLRHYRKFDPS
jgi:hypothetical protein